VPNSYIKADQIVQAAILLLQREIVLPRTVWVQPDAANAYGLDDTLTLRILAVLTANRRTMRASAALSAGTLAETKVPVKLTDHVYNLLNITDEELTLDIRDFSAQVLQPQIRAVAEGIEETIATTLGNVTWEADPVSFDGDTDKGFDVLIAAGKELNKLNVPRANRYFVCGADVEAALFGDDRIVKANEAGTDTALREATIARLAGFTVVGSNALDPEEAYAYHMTAVGLAAVAPALPDGATMKSRVAAEGMALRFLCDYNPSNSTGPVDRSLVDVFVGAASVEEGAEGSETNRRGVEITFSAS